jgi:hypothetical protein
MGLRRRGNEGALRISAGAVGSLPQSAGAEDIDRLRERVVIGRQRLLSEDGKRLLDAN